MRRMIVLLLALMLALPVASSGEGSDVPVDAFIARTGIDAALRERSRTSFGIGASPPGR